MTATPDTLITIKVLVDDNNRKFKLALKDLGVGSFDEKLRNALNIPADQKLIIERFSDSSSSFIILDKTIPATYKQLYRAAKAKLKLRLRVILLKEPAKQRDQSSVEVLPTQQPIVDLMGQMKCGTNISAGSKNTKQAPRFTSPGWQVCCNNCDKPMADSHFHCSICDNGDFDLCEGCVDSGVTCQAEGHWLIKRFIKNGAVVTSTTERIAPKSRNEKLGMPGTFVPEVKANSAKPEPRRTCNSCVRALPEKLLITCLDCEDYDLCIACHVQNTHGHHPAHAFEAISKDAEMPGFGVSLLKPGRNIRHTAVCDGCEQSIYGVRNKCLDCPDWDFCAECHASDVFNSHTGQHRFIPIYDRLENPRGNKGRHYGVFCDGPLCALGKNKSQDQITGIRYKCAICNDLDFCANCEAHPDNKHNVTHPLIKFKTMVRDVSVETYDDVEGEPVRAMGDLPMPKLFNDVEDEPVRTTEDLFIGDLSMRPASPAPGARMGRSNSTIGLMHAGIETKLFKTSDKATQSVNVPSADLDAHFERETVVDGSLFPSRTQLHQTWTVRNPGPHAWPAGCRICVIGGDSMLDVDLDQPMSSADLASAKESNLTTRIVNPGECHDFTVRLRTPGRSGMCISYWRLKAPDGTPFGHKLWCDVGVVHYNTLDPAKISIQTLILDLMQGHNIENEEQRVPKAELRDLIQRLESFVALPADSLKEIKQELDAKAAIEESEQPPTSAEGAPQENVSESQMVFPTLETESPTSSTRMEPHTTEAAPLKVESSQEAAPSTAATETETETTVGSPEAQHKGLENINFSDSSDDEQDRFLTDDEYDILDASDDEEAVNGGKS
ncbi:MAG: hypothetical protein M1828_007652 [Chrysothrix sp. TS-e1954]|nr:MAG: hypothetical protein M1828_007652 [Chrysothrix sp. TS-e1954]